MKFYEKIYSLLCEVEGGSRKRSKEGMDAIPRKNTFRSQPRTPDTGSELDKSRDARIAAGPSRETKDVMLGSRLLSALKKEGLPPLKRAQLQKAYDRLQTGGKTKSANENLKINSYEKIYLMLTEAMTPKQKKRFEAGQKIFGKTKKFTPGGGRVPYKKAAEERKRKGKEK